MTDKGTTITYATSREASPSGTRPLVAGDLFRWGERPAVESDTSPRVWPHGGWLRPIGTACFEVVLEENQPLIGSSHAIPDAFPLERLLPASPEQVPPMTGVWTFPDAGMVLYAWVSRESPSTMAPPGRLGGDGGTSDPKTTAEEKLLSTAEEIFANARDEVFENGMESSFSRALTSLIQTHGNLAVGVLERILSLRPIGDEAISEALRQIGLMRHPPSHEKRLRILTRYLFSRSVRLRDAASVGLAALDDPGAIPALTRVLGREPSPSLRHDLATVLKQLEATQAEASVRMR